MKRFKKVHRGLGWVSGLLVLGLSVSWIGSVFIARKAGATYHANENWRPSESIGRAGEPLTIWQRQDYRAIDRVFDSIQSDFDPELLKAIAWVESRWQHLKPDRLIFVTANYKKEKPGRAAAYITLDWGLMQINDRLESLDPRDWSLERIRTDPECNLRAAIAVLASKRAYIKRLRRQPNWEALQTRYRLQGHSDTDILLKAYNGFQPSWAYVHKVKAAWATKPWQQAILRQWLNQAVRPDVELGAGFDPTLAATAGSIPFVAGWSQLKNDMHGDILLSESIFTLAAVLPSMKQSKNRPCALEEEK